MLWILGMGFAVLSLLTSTTSLIIQKYSTVREAGLACHLRWRFWAACAMNVLSEVTCSTVAVSLAPLVLLSPLNGLAVVFNALLTHFGCICGVKERLPPSGWTSTCTIVCGIALIAASGPGSTESVEFTMAEVPALLRRAHFVGFSIALWTLVGAWLLSRGACQPSPAVISRCSALSAAACGAYSVTALKITVKGISEVVADDESSREPPLVLFGAIAILCTVAPSQLYLLHTALTHGNATFAIPIYLSTMTVLISTIGGVLFGEFDALARDPFPLYLLMYLAGLALLVAGLVFLARSQARMSLIASGSAPQGGASAQSTSIGVEHAPKARQAAPIAPPSGPS